MGRGPIRTLVVAVVLGAAAPGAASADVTLTSLTDPATAEASARAIVRIEHGSASRILQRSFALGGFDVSSMPPAGTDALGMLLGAIDAAEELRAHAVAGLSARERALVLEPWKQVGRSAPFGGRLELDPRVLDIAARVDLSLFARAALTIVTAVEQTAPALGVLPSEKLAPAGCPGVGGDAIYESEDCSIIVAAQTSNTYGLAADPMLLIDLGGNDVYNGDSAFAGGTVEVLIDVAGDDTYERTESFDEPIGPSEATTAQGGGALGVGVLADLAGNDTYRVSAGATAPEPGPSARGVGATGQGVGIAGAGVLLDGGGNDSYHLTSSSSGGPATTMGQASGVGAAALIDLGTEDDSWQMTAVSTVHEGSEDDGVRPFWIGSATSVGQGAAVLGGAVAIDVAGDDAFGVAAQGADAYTYSHGASIGGIGVLIDGSGSDSMNAEARGNALTGFETDDPGVCWNVELSVETEGASAIGQGAATLGAGFLIDGGGDDERSLHATNTAEGFATVESARVCDGQARNEALVYADAGPGTAAGQGWAEAAGAAALLDLGGADRYQLRAESIAIAAVTISSPGPDHATAETVASPATSRGHGSVSVGASLLLDALGNDSYESDTRTITTETETIDGVTTAISSTVAGDERIQGYSLGRSPAWFVDLDGDDSYSSFAGATQAADNRCWSNGPSSDGRGRDLSLAVPTGCP
jgi:hypothetical protein